MCRPIRSLTEGRGFDTRNHRLAIFGGAGGQHACSIARNLRINTVIIHKYSSMLSAYGMALAEVVQEALEPSSEVFNEDSLQRMRAKLASLQEKVKEELLDQNFSEDNLRFERYLNMRYQGTDTSLMILEPENGDFEAAFLAHHLREFTFTVPGRPILVDDIRVRGMATDGTTPEAVHLVDQLGKAKNEAVYVDKLKPAHTAKVYFQETKHISTPIYVLNELPTHSTVPVRLPTFRP